MAEPERDELDRLVTAATEGDPGAFSRLTEKYRRELHVHCYRMLGSFDEAEDLVQETLLQAWHGRCSFARRSTFRAWLYAIATNTCLDHLRRGRLQSAPVSAAASGRDRRSRVSGRRMAPAVPRRAPRGGRSREPDDREGDRIARLRPVSRRPCHDAGTPPVVPGDPTGSAGNEDGPAADPAVAKVVDGVVGGV
jgi:RNA polymerase sigma factor (sigma-70 family)